MSAILRRICEVEVQNNFILYLYIGLANQHEEYGKGEGDTEHLGNLQESERYVIHISGTVTVWAVVDMLPRRMGVKEDSSMGPGDREHSASQDRSSHLSKTELKGTVAQDFRS